MYYTDWLSYKAHILIICYLQVFYCKALLISEGHFMYVIENIQVDSLKYNSILFIKEKM